MGMIFCRGCGKEIHESAPACPHCSAPQSAINVTTDTIPDGIKGWSWGAFLLGPLWAMYNKTWIGLLVIVPYVGFIMSIILGFKGREWAWKNKQWDSVEHFNRVQKKWSFWGVIVVGSSIAIGIIAGAGVAIYSSQHRTQEVAATKNSEDTFQAQQTTITPQIDASNAITGLWTGDLEGHGEMKIKPSGAGFDVLMSVSSDSGCAGTIQALGTLTGNTLTLMEKDDDQVCTITVKFSGSTAEVNEQNCWPNHGAACGFSGTLRKVQLQ